MSLGVIPVFKLRDAGSADRPKRSFSLSLTDLEIIGFGMAADLASGHAYHDLPAVLLPVVGELPQLWRDACKATPLELEASFKASFARLSGLSGLNRLRFCRPCPSASNSIDLVATLLRDQQRRTLLVEPTFDNLALLTKRRGVSIAAIDEESLFDPKAHHRLVKRLERDRIGALFMVSPTNPTGRCMDAETLTQLAQICRRRDVLLVMDASFRLFNRNPADDLDILQKSDVSFVVFEDTGKTFPTLDTKVSLIYGSDDIGAQLETLYNEVYLCTSGIALALLTRVVDLAYSAGLNAAVWSIVDQRRMELRASLVGTGLAPARETFQSVVGVEWLDCEESGLNDVEVCEQLGRLGVAAVTGRQFFWASQDDPRKQSRVRMSMMKPRQSFAAAISAFELLRCIGGLGAQFSARARPSPIFRL